MSYSPYYKSESHYINCIRKIYRDKFEEYLPKDKAALFGIVYKVGHFHNLFYEYNLDNLPEKVNWDFKTEVKCHRTFEKFCKKIYNVLLEINIFIKNTDELYSGKCSNLLRYCHKNYIKGKNKNSWSKYNKNKYHPKERWVFNGDLKIEGRKNLAKLDMSKTTTQVLGKLISVSGVYFIYNEDKELIYIGKSYDLSSRIRGSLSERDGCFFSYMITNNRADADILEPYMIATLKPPCNGDYLTSDKPSFKIKEPKMSRMYDARLKERDSEL